MKLSERRFKLLTTHIPAKIKGKTRRYGEKYETS